MYDLANALRVLPGMLAILLTGLAIGCTVDPPVGAVVRITTLEAIKSLRAFRLLFLE